MGRKAQKMLEALAQFFVALTAESQLWQALEAPDSFFNDVLLERFALAGTFVVLALLLKNGVGPMVLKEEHLFIRKEHAQEQSKVGMNTNKAPDIQVLLEACCCLFAQLHLLTIRAEPADAAKTFTVGRSEVLCRLYVAVETSNVCLGERFDWLVCLETGLQDCGRLLLLVLSILLLSSGWNLLLDRALVHPLTIYGHQKRG